MEAACLRKSKNLSEMSALLTQYVLDGYLFTVSNTKGVDATQSPFAVAGMGQRALLLCGNRHHFAEGDPEDPLVVLRSRLER